MRSTHASASGFVWSFSPLFIGEDSSIQSTRTHSMAYGNFQSPLHRGRLFNDVAGAELGGLYVLSVPSSSGKTLQWRGLRRSSLHLRTFQSPLHRGRLFNMERASFGNLPSSAFSPLFIGEDSSILAVGSLYVVNASFQSPLHRGRLFNYRYKGLRTGCVLLSVPSSSGKTLQ